MHTCTEALEAALAAIDAAAGDNPDEKTRLIKAKCRGLMRGYDARWRDEPWKVLAVETMLEADLYNIDTGAKSRTFRIAGKLDAIVEIDGKRVLVDRKTTSQDISDANAPYWRQLAVESQVSHYFLLAHINGEKFDYAIWDVIRKPGISPAKLTKAERTSAVAERAYCGMPLEQACLDKLQTEERETLPMYEARLAQDCTVERPERYFQRRAVPRLDSEIAEYAREMWHMSQDMLATRRHGRDYRNSGACFNYGTPCQFLGVCSGHDSIDSDNWKTKPSVHSELPGLQGDGRDVLTNSRLRTYQSCRRNHRYRYEDGIERNVDEEERDAKWFGSLMHTGLEAWALTFQE